MDNMDKKHPVSELMRSTIEKFTSWWIPTSLWASPSPPLTA